MELNKAFRTSSGATPMLHNARNIAYEILMVRYLWRIAGGIADGEGFRAMLSIRDGDQVENTDDPDIESILEEPGLLLPVMRTFERLTSGTVFIEGDTTLVLPELIRVPYLSFRLSHFWTANHEIGVEVGFRRVVVPAEQKAHLILAAGGRARS